MKILKNGSKIIVGKVEGTTTKKGIKQNRTYTIAAEVEDLFQKLEPVITAEIRATMLKRVEKSVILELSKHFNVGVYVGFLFNHIEVERGKITVVVNSRKRGS